MKKAGTILLISAFFCTLVLLNIKGMGKLQNLTGKTFGDLYVIEFHEKTPIGADQTMINWWWCRCLRCGKELRAKTASLNNGNAACHCSRGKHRMCETKEYAAWRSMQQRCANPKHKSYHRYGGRGITVCDRWMGSFENFFSDMGLSPSKKHSLDRIKNALGYFPGNCRWATSKEQSSNKENNRRISFNNEVKTLSEWSVSSRIPKSTVINRLNDGWSIEDALTKPSRFRSPNKKTRA